MGNRDNTASAGHGRSPAVKGLASVNINTPLILAARLRRREVRPRGAEITVQAGFSGRQRPRMSVPSGRWLMTIVSQMVPLLRRVFWLAVVGGAGFAGWSAWSRRNASANMRPPEWPTIEPPVSVAPAASHAAEPVDNAPAASPAEVSPSGALAWVAPDGGACPSSHPIKANSNSGIFHVPGGRFYDQTRAERCYGLAEDAEADGYRRAKR